MDSTLTALSSSLPSPDMAGGADSFADDGGFDAALGQGGSQAALAAGLPFATQPGAGQGGVMQQGGSGGTAPGSSATTSAAGTTGTGAAGDAQGDAAVPSIDNSSFSSPDSLAKWAPLVQGMPQAQQQAAEVALNRPMVAAQMLKSGDAGQKAAAQAYFDANPSMKAALDTAAHGGKPDGKISDHDIDSFVSKMSKQLDRASKTVSDYQKKNPSADGQSLQLVRQSALLQANMPILLGASPDKDGKIGGEVTQAGIQAVAQNNPGLSSALTGAASTFSQPGMFGALDQGGKTGTDLATHNADGKFDENNITGWVNKQAPTTGGQFASLISDAATRSSVAGVDTSSLNSDVFANPQKYTGAQKAAVLVQLQTKQQQLDAGSSLRKSDDTNKAVVKDIAQLSADPDVQKYLGQATVANEKAIVGSDPSLANAVQTTYANDVVTGKALQDGLDGVARNNADKKNTKETDGSAVSDFSQEAQLDSDLSDGQSATAAGIVGSNASLATRLQSDYQSDFSQGGELKQLQGEKKADLGTSLQTMEGDQQAFAGVLNPGFVQSQQAAYAQSSTQIATGDGSGKAVMDALGGGGSADPSDIAQSISETPPSQLYGTAQPSLTATDTKSLVNVFLNDLKSGTSVSDACAKFDPNSKSFDPKAADSGLMSKLQANPQAASSARTMLQNLAQTALGLPGSGGAAAASGGAAAPGAAVFGGAAAGAAGPGGPVAGEASASQAAAGGSAAGAATAGAADAVTADATVAGGPSYAGSAGSGGSTAAGAQTQAAAASGGGSSASSILGSGPVPSSAPPSETASQRTQEGLMYSSIGMMGGSLAAGAAGLWNRKRSGVDDAARAGAASRISLAGEAAGGVGGALGAAFMLPGISSELKNGEGAQAGLSIAGSARGIVQGGALAYNVGRFAAGRTGGQFAADGLGRLAGSVTGRVVGSMSGAAAGTAAGSAATGAVAGESGGEVAGEVAGRVVGVAAAEAVAAAAGPVGWAIDAAIGIGFVGEAIAAAVKKAHQRKAMDKTVDPTLKQYGIPTPH